MIRINNIKIKNNISDEELLDYVIKSKKINKSDIIEWNISKKSIDARNKNNIFLLYSIDLKLKNENKYKKFETIKETIFPKISVNYIEQKRPVIIGAGPSGLFAALTFIKNGLPPIVIEQGECVENRKISVDIFLKNGNLNISSNVQFGEGGAGTFSDGKLTTRNKQYLL